MSAEEQLTRLQNNQRASQRIALRARRKTVTLGATESTTCSSRPLTIDGLQVGVVIWIKTTLFPSLNPSTSY